MRKRRPLKIMLERISVLVPSKTTGTVWVWILLPYASGPLRKQQFLYFSPLRTGRHRCDPLSLLTNAHGSFGDDLIVTHDGPDFIHLAGQGTQIGRAHV